MPSAKEHEDNIAHRHRVYRTYRSKADARRNLWDLLADFLTSKFGSVTFLIVNACAFYAWIFINTGHLPGIKVFDPYPFALLTMAVSLEAIFLAIIVLISQNRAARIEEMREEINLQINTVSEGEVSKLIYLMTLLLKKQGVDVEGDPDLQVMSQPIDNASLEKALEKQLGE